jgi:peptide-methionine (S)-S-oxide reductase
MNAKNLLLLLAAAFAFVGCAPSAGAQPNIKDAAVPKGASELVLGAGCFWCIEALIEDLKGVYAVEAGYAGGPAKANYQNIGNGAEVVKVFFDPKVVSRDDLLRIFFVAHDPTTLNRQGPDYGTQYRSAIFYSTESEKDKAKLIMAEAQKLYKDKIVTTLEPLTNYVRAEEYHQNYFAKYEKASAAEKAQMNAGYCSAIIEPKVRKFREKYLSKLKKG